MAKLVSILAIFSVFSLQSTRPAWAGVDGGISGNVTDNQGVAVSNATVQLQKADGTVIKAVQVSPTGDYTIFPVTLGDYKLSVKVPGFAPYESSVHVAGDSTTQANISLVPPAEGKEMVLNVIAKRHSVQTSTATSSKEIDSEQIADLPQGENISMPHLLSTTIPGVIQQSFGQMFFRGNHANIQYQIDGVQLPDSQTNTFGDAFTPRNIDHMEVITGGIPAEYGERLSGVVNIVTKSGSENPGGEAEVNYGSYNTFSPWATYGGSNEKGDLHYFVSAQYTRTDRGLDTPQPQSDGGSCGFACANQKSGGTDAIHDSSNGNNQFAKIDWIPDNDNKLSVVLFNSYTFYQIPNYPSSMLPSDPFFQGGQTDQFQNNNGTSPIFNWTPSTTNDTQANDDAYVELLWKHTFTEHSFLQTSPYYKYSLVHVNNDPSNDLLGASLIPNALSSSFAEDRHINNMGIKGDFTDRVGDSHLFKMGYQLQDSMASGPINVAQGTNTGGTFGSVTGQTTTTSVDNSTAEGLSESVYAQDDFTITKKLILNVGLRFDAIQYHFDHTELGDVTSADNMIQPRIGVNYFVGDNTKLHAFYGRLFQPAPLEDLRDTFVDTVGQQCSTFNFYDIKAEEDNYWETGIAQQVGNYVFNLTGYYKNAKNLLDDTQLLNTSLAAAYNYTKGYAYGIEASFQGKINDSWSDYGNYAYETAKGEGASGGLFALPTGTPIPQGYLYLDHVQIHTATAGVTYAQDYFHWMTQGLFGSGLRTGVNNTLSLNSHFTMDTSVGYDVHGDSWLTKFKVSADLLNVFNNAYPVTVANGFNGSHYAPGREYFLHLTKEL